MTSRQGTPFVVAAPSGAGKTTACRRLLERDPQVVFSISHTTRAMRSGESNGRDYHFVDQSVFDEMVGRDEFLEWANYGGNCYGTSWGAIRSPLSEGRDVLLEIEVQGARQVRKRLPEARLIFLMPPSLKELASRLRGRRTDSEEQVEKRLRIAEGELRAVEEFDYAIFNEELEDCVEGMLEVVRAERRGDTADVRARFEPGAAAQRFRYSSPST